MALVLSEIDYVPPVAKVSDRAPAAPPLDIAGRLEKVRAPSAVGRLVFSSLSQEEMEQVRRMAWEMGIPVRAKTSKANMSGIPVVFRIERSATWF